LSNNPSNPGSPQDRIWLALRFGWTLAEVYGRLSENPPPDTASSSTRLFVSDLNPTPNERLWIATRRLIYLAGQLFPAHKPEEQSEEQAAQERAKPGLPETPACIADLLQHLEERMPGSGKLPGPAAVYDDLNRWSRQIWAALDAEDPFLAEAATLGARLADTFWQLPFPTRQRSDAETQAWQARWRGLLKSQRMNTIIGHLWQVEAHLPAHVGPTLRHSLWEWGIAGQLTRNPSGRLEISWPFLYGFRSLRWAQSLRRMLSRRRHRPPVSLSLQEEQALWKQIQRQVVTWEHLIFNRPVDYLLLPSDWRHIRWVTMILYALAILLILTAGAALVALTIVYVSRVVGFLLPFLDQPTDFKDQLTLVSTLAAVLAFLVTQFRRALQRLRQVDDLFRHWVTMRKLEQRGLRAWNGRVKPLRWIWLQRILRAESRR